MKNLSALLKPFGFSEHEITIYCTAVTHGPQTVMELSRQSGLSRQVVYVAIEALLKRELVHAVPRGKRKWYTAEPAEKIIGHLKRQQSEQEERLGELERALLELNRQQDGHPHVRIIEGKQAIRAWLEELDRSGVEALQIDEMTDLNALRSLVSAADLKPLHDYRNKKGLRLRALSYGAPLSPNNRKERYLLPDRFGNFKSNLTILGDYIYFATFEDKMHSVIIESKALAKTLHILYELAFQNARQQFLKR